MQDADWTRDVRAAYATRGIGERLGEAALPALVVVDLVRGFTDPGCPPGSDLDDVVGETARLLATARDSGAPVLFTSIAFDEFDLANSVWLRKMPAMRVLTEGSSHVDVDPRLDRRPGEPVIAKKAASAFTGTSLAASLRASGARSVVVCGATTSGCVRATVIDACAHNLPTFVPRACVGDRAREPHEANLLDIEAKYADVVETERASTLLKTWEAA